MKNVGLVVTGYVFPAGFGEDEHDDCVLYQPPRWLNVMN